MCVCVRPYKVLCKILGNFNRYSNEPHNFVPPAHTLTYSTSFVTSGESNYTHFLRVSIVIITLIYFLEGLPLCGTYTLNISYLTSKSSVNQRLSSSWQWSTIRITLSSMHITHLIQHYHSGCKPLTHYVEWLLRCALHEILVNKNLAHFDCAYIPGHYLHIHE